jgi:hypothetical protein
MPKLRQQKRVLGRSYTPNEMHSGFSIYVYHFVIEIGTTCAERDHWCGSPHSVNRNNLRTD